MIFTWWKPTERCLYGVAALLLLGLALALGAGPSLLLAGTVGALLLLPGLALLRILDPVWHSDWTETVALSVGLSLASYPLLLAWMTWLGGHWSPILAAALLALCTALIIARLRHPPVVQPSPMETVLLLGLVLAVTLVLRLDHLRGLLLPAWSDSYQHVMVSQLIITGGRIPANYGPLIEISSFHYHFGFHALVAFAAWLTGWPAHQAVLVMGQVLNALSGLTVYFFLAYGLRNQRAGIVGAMIVSLLTIAPASYINYGRYPQLAGQVLLPVPMALTLRSLWAQEGEHRPWLLGAISAAGLALTHYRVVLFYACFVLANLLVLAWVHRREPRRWLKALLGAGRLAAVALLLVAPWLVHLGSILSQRLQRSSAIAAGDQSNDLTWQFVVGWGAAAPLIISSALGAVWAMVRRCGRVIGVVLWVVLLFLIANPRWLHLPTTFITNGAVVLALYLPVGILGGYLVDEVLRGLEQRWGARATSIMLAALVLAGVLVGACTLNRRILEPWRFFVTPDDLQAAAWIREHIPTDAMFAIQPHKMGPLSIHGVDAGFWLPYLAERRTTLPPMPYNGELDREAADAINRRALDTFLLPDDHQALARLRAQGVTHVYVVEPRISFYNDLWQPARFAGDPAYRLLYHQGSVWIFALNGG